LAEVGKFYFDNSKAINSSNISRIWSDIRALNKIKISILKIKLEKELYKEKFTTPKITKDVTAGTTYSINLSL